MPYYLNGLYIWSTYLANKDTFSKSFRRIKYDMQIKDNDQKGLDLLIF